MNEPLETWQGADVLPVEIVQDMSMIRSTMDVDDCQMQRRVGVST
jgi:hypothetical protein